MSLKEKVTQSLKTFVIHTNVIVFGKLFKGSYRSQFTLQCCHPVWKIYFISYNTMYSIFWQCLYFLKLHVYEYFTEKRFYFKSSPHCFKWTELKCQYILHAHINVHKTFMCDWFNFDIDHECLLLYFTKNNVNEYKNVSMI